ncbi:hypothetical protein O1M63_31445 [Streptomyces mirabilis]|nr:hypothetical protein [Streptomyces mirabilis]
MKNTHAWPGRPDVLRVLADARPDELDPARLADSRGSTTTWHASWPERRTAARHAPRNRGASGSGSGRSGPSWLSRPSRRRWWS